MNPTIEKSIAPVTTSFYSLALAVVVLSVVAVIVANLVGGKTKKQRQATVKLVFALGMVIFALVFLPKILGIHG